MSPLFGWCVEFARKGPNSGTHESSTTAKNAVSLLHDLTGRPKCGPMDDHVGWCATEPRPGTFTLWDCYSAAWRPKRRLNRRFQTSDVRDAMITILTIDLMMTCVGRRLDVCPERMDMPSLEAAIPPNGRRREKFRLLFLSMRSIQRPTEARSGAFKNRSRPPLISS